MNIKFKPAVALLPVVGFLCWLPGAAPAANLMVNGSFEGTTYVDSATGNVIPTGWLFSPSGAVSKANVDDATDAATGLGAQEGSHYFRFQSTAKSSRDCLYQVPYTTSGQQYRVSFWVAITSTSEGNTCGLDPVWDEGHANETHMGTNQFYFVPVNTGPVRYQFFSFIEIASGTATKVIFHGIDANGSILLDNVVVEAVTDPSPVAPLFSLAGIANRQLSFSLGGSTGSNYVVQATTDLGVSSPTWTSLVTNAAPFTFVEPNVDLLPRRFYRALVAP